MAKKKVRAGLVFLSFALVSCNAWDDECNFPTSAYSEIGLLGATITHCVTSLNETYHDGEEPFVTANLNLYFSPSPERETIEFEIRNDELSRYVTTTQYNYTFSQLVNDQFQLIAPNHATFDPQGPATQYSSAVRIQSFPEKLIVNGNHLIATSIGSSIAVPARATHVELWFQNTPEDEIKLVRRIALESFEFWKSTLKPLIPLSVTS